MKNDLCALPLTRAAALLSTKEISSRELTQATLAQIAHRDPEVAAYLTLCEKSALSQADTVDAARAAGEELPPLAGIPYALKDNMCTTGIRTTCASKILENFVPPYDATVYKLLQAQRGVLLGKLNMDEFAMGSSTETSYFQKTTNPCDPARVPGGSSGGSAASVGACEAFFSLGTDTGGSIRQPASLCGVVGLKPTYGLVSRFGIVAFASSLDQVGPLTRTVEDSATVLSAIAHPDPMDTSCLPGARPDFVAATRQDVRGLRIGLPKEYFELGIHPATADAVRRAADLLQQQGAILTECSLPHTKYGLAAYYLVASAEASSNLARYDGIKYGYRSENYDSLEDLYRSTRSEGFGPEVQRRIMLGTFVLSAGYYDAYYKKGQQMRTLMRRDFDAAFENVDVLLTPVSPTTAWRFDRESVSLIETYAADICTVPVNLTGLPGLSLPCGKDSLGLPIGAQFIGKPLGECDIYRAGSALEAAVGTWEDMKK